MNRREFLSATAGGLVTTAASALFSSSANAHNKVAVGDFTVTDPKALKALHAVAKAAADCVAAGQACVQHCNEELIKGEKDFANCTLAVHQMLATCQAIETLAHYKAKLIVDLLEGCIKACEACRLACKEHEAHFSHGMHLACKRCMEACEKCAQACRDLKSVL